MTSLPYRLCAIDLDDTLLGPDHKISARNARGVHALLQQQVTVVIASGRMHESTVGFAEQLGLDTPIISYNGAMVRKPHTGEILLHEQIPGELATPILDYCAEHHLQLNYYFEDHLYTAAYTPWIKLYYDRTLAPITVRPDMEVSLRGTDPTKLIIIDTPEKTDSLLPMFRDRFGSKLYITKSNDEYLEFMPPNANKGAALESVAHIFQVSAAQTIAFGDSWNDIPMLRWAGMGIAVANAKPGALAAADRVTLRSDEDGVAVALEEIFGFQNLQTF